MNKKKVKSFLLITLTSSLLSSCDIFEGIVFIDNQQIVYDIGNNLDILNEVFNGTTNNNGESLLNDYSNFDQSDSNYTKIQYNTTDLEYNDGGLPSTNNINSLVIPIDFSDYEAKKIETSYTHMEYQSVYSYFYNSSYGQLSINFDVLPYTRMNRPSSYYSSISHRFSKYSGECPGVSAIIDEVFKKLDKSIDFSKYDNDDDGYIDSFYIIYSTPIDNYNYDFWWAYQYYYLENTTYDKVSPYYYVFAAYDFIFDSNIYELTAESFIHETGHLLNIEDYYDYDSDEGYNKGGLGGADMQDSNLGDHNPFTKMCLGWINPILVNVDEKSKEKNYKIRSFSDYGDVLMICDNYDDTKGVFQDYFLITYFRNDSLLNQNIYDDYNELVYQTSGVKVYRVHGELEEFENGSDSYTYFKYDNSYTDYNIIDSIIKKVSINGLQNSIYSSKDYLNICASDDDLFKENDESGDLYYYDKKSKTKSNYSFKVVSINEYEVTITITYNFDK